MSDLIGFNQYPRESADRENDPGHFRNLFPNIEVDDNLIDSYYETVYTLTPISPDSKTFNFHFLRTVCD